MMRVFINLAGLTGKRAAVELLKIALLCYLEQHLGEHKHFYFRLTVYVEPRRTE